MSSGRVTKGGQLLFVCDLCGIRTMTPHQDRWIQGEVGRALNDETPPSGATIHGCSLGCFEQAFSSAATVIANEFEQRVSAEVSDAVEKCFLEFDENRRDSGTGDRDAFRAAVRGMLRGLLV